MKRIYLCVIILLLIGILSACLAGPNPMEKKSNKEGKVAGFWKGLWHGFIAPITFIISIFSSEVRFYEVYNSGFWYNFGFVLAAGLFLSGGVLGRSKKKKKKK
jgi:ABC-type multidrug transport system permease subunit